MYIYFLECLGLVCYVIVRMAFFIEYSLFNKMIHSSAADMQYKLIVSLMHISFRQPLLAFNADETSGLS